MTDFIYQCIKIIRIFQPDGIAGYNYSTYDLARFYREKRAGWLS